MLNQRQDIRFVEVDKDDRDYLEIAKSFFNGKAGTESIVETLERLIDRYDRVNTMLT